MELRARSRSARSRSSARASYPAARHALPRGRRARVPGVRAPDRERVVRRFFADPSYAGVRAGSATMYDVARRVAGRRDDTVRSRARARVVVPADGRVPVRRVAAARRPGRRSSSFVTRTKAGYCQHFAGAMAVMLRMLGVPARVAVGLHERHAATDGAWVVTDHDAHAWVEVWFAGSGWIPFDPTPGRGTLGGEYSFASGSQDGGRCAPAGRARRRRASARPTRASRTRAISLWQRARRASERAPSLVGVGFVLVVLWIVAVGLGKAARPPRALPLARSPPPRDREPSRARGLPPRSGRRRVGANATLAALQRAVRDGARARRPGRSPIARRSRALRASGDRRARRATGAARSSAGSCGRRGASSRSGRASAGFVSLRSLRSCGSA